MSQQDFENKFTKQVKEAINERIKKFALAAADELIRDFNYVVKAKIHGAVRDVCADIGKTCEFNYGEDTLSITIPLNRPQTWKEAEQKAAKGE